MTLYVQILTIHFYLIPSTNVKFLFPPTSNGHLPSTTIFLDRLTMVAKGNASKTPKIES
jgi:hypothetical protein